MNEGASGAGQSDSTVSGLQDVATLRHAVEERWRKGHISQISVENIWLTGSLPFGNLQPSAISAIFAIVAAPTSMLP